MDPAKMYNSIPNTLHDIASSYRYIYLELFEIIDDLQSITAAELFSTIEA
jgi:hypothetical protein